MNKFAVIAVVCAAVAFVACRREAPYEPMKLGGDVKIEKAR